MDAGLVVLKEWASILMQGGSTLKSRGKAGKFLQLKGSIFKIHGDLLSKYGGDGI